MKAVFYVGSQNQQRVEVFSSYLGTREAVEVNGRKVYEKKRIIPFWFTQNIKFSITPENEDREYAFQLKYNGTLMQSEAYVDGKLHCACLFPQVVGYNALIIAIAALILTVVF